VCPRGQSNHCPSVAGLKVRLADRPVAGSDPSTRRKFFKNQIGTFSTGDAIEGSIGVGALGLKGPLAGKAALGSIDECADLKLNQHDLTPVARFVMARLFLSSYSGQA